MVDRRYVRTRRQRSMISAAGPLTNATCAVLCALPLATGFLHFDVTTFDIHGAHDAFPAALAFLTLLEVIATVLNALPIPGFDGFGVLMPYLPEDLVRQLMPIAQFAWLALFLLLFSVAAAGTAFFGFSDHILTLLGVNHRLGDYGQALFTFWRKLP
jgi:Zn-dependent protease